MRSGTSKCELDWKKFFFLYIFFIGKLNVDNVFPITACSFSKDVASVKCSRIRDIVMPLLAENYQLGH
jgi:hypothetical protein